MVLNPVAVLHLNGESVYTPSDIETEHPNIERLAATSLCYHDWRGSTPVEWLSSSGIVYQANIGDIDAYVYERDIDHVTVYDADSIPNRVQSSLPTT
jgi:hypothetical protein